MSLRQHLAYGFLGAPLAMAALPVYIHTPKLYGGEFGLGLVLTGLILLLSRAVDTIQDPWLGRLSDYMSHRPGGWALLAWFAASILGLSYAALFNPPQLSTLWLGVWFGAMLVLSYTAHSALNITYLAWGARASENTHVRTRLVAIREGFALFGVIIASLLPMILAYWFDLRLSWLIFSLAFVLLLIPAVWLLLGQGPKPKVSTGEQFTLLQPLRNKSFRRLSVLFFLNGLAIALAATLSLFYIADVLMLEAYSGALLAVYFISGACSLPIWTWSAKRFGKTLSWMAGTLVAVIGFVWAVQLGPGDIAPYIIICLMSGFALGADLALPASIAADVIPARDHGHTGSYFGIWSLINKAVLALGAGVSLPLLASLGYEPGESEGLMALALIYAGLPCLIKLMSALLLLRWRGSLEVTYAH